MARGRLVWRWQLLPEAIRLSQYQRDSMCMHICVALSCIVLYFCVVCEVFVGCSVICYAVVWCGGFVFVFVFVFVWCGVGVVWCLVVVRWSADLECVFIDFGNLLVIVNIDSFDDLTTVLVLTMITMPNCGNMITSTDGTLPSEPFM